MSFLDIRNIKILELENYLELQSTHWFYISINSGQVLYFLYVILTNVTFFFLIISFISLAYALFVLIYQYYFCFFFVNLVNGN